MQLCICDVIAWATANMLKLNDKRTTLMLFTSKRDRHIHRLPTSTTIGNAQVTFKQSVKNLGFTLDCHLTTNAHVSNIARTLEENVFAFLNYTTLRFKKAMFPYVTH